MARLARAKIMERRNAGPLNWPQTELTEVV